MKKRQAITGVRQKASTAHSSITTTLIDYQATKLGGPPRPHEEIQIRLTRK
jgi:hypothetical protein